MFSSDGALHLAAQLRTGEDEGGGWAHIAYLYARKDKSGSLTHYSPSAWGKGGGCDDLPQLLVEGATAQYLFIETDYDLSLFSNTGSGWKQLGNAGVSAEDSQTIGQHLLAAWRDQDAVRLLTNKRLYRIEGAQIVDAVAVSGPCDMSKQLCYVAYGSASTATEAVTVGAEGMKLSQLSCEAGQKQCTWTETGTTLSGGAGGGTSCRRGRFLFHTSDAGGSPTPVFVRNVQPTSGPTYRVLASTPDGELELVAQNSYFLGASALPGGGYAVAVEDYDEQLHLMVVDPDLKSKRVFDLGRQPYGFMNNWLTVIGSGTSSSDQLVHVIFGFGASTVRHLTIEPSSGEIKGEEQIDLRG